MVNCTLLRRLDVCLFFPPNKLLNGSSDFYHIWYRHVIYFKLLCLFLGLCWYYKPTCDIFYNCMSNVQVKFDHSSHVNMDLHASIYTEYPKSRLYDPHHVNPCSILRQKCSWLKFRQYSFPQIKVKRCGNTANHSHTRKWTL